ncbi:ANTH domain protein [Niveomyces insectorum RCEF 264]|uniref:ANTH domain protein n=1 Tax=Niveomyces insectorum RCEF 264 TaxID=1081102 RepID=A0A167UY09_9HYPO|nr:ANTH domain protein [Niveomyces insectorum RCEF 264]
MASSFEKSVKGATKVKLAPPKTKYIEHILIATHAGEAGVGEVFRALQYRLHDSTWTTVFKSLITAHLMIREGSPDVTLAYLAKNRNLLAPTSISDAQSQGRNIRHYANYLNERARAYRETKTDWVRVKETRLEKLSVEKGLLRETETVQHQLTALLKCDVVDNETGNEITIFVFRLLVLDLLALFQVLNQAMINILGHFFEMSKVDAQRAMKIYLNFTRQTDYVVQYLSVARQYEHHTRVEVPKLKHAPVNLGRQLEEYLQDPDFEVHRRQYLAELDAKKSQGGSSGGGASAATRSDAGQKNVASVNRSNTTHAASSVAPKPAAKAKGPDPDLIDFFGSIEQNQTPMAAQPAQPQQMAPTGVTPWGVPNNGGVFAAPQQTGLFQQNGLAAQPTGFQQTNPFQMQQATGAFFGQPPAPQQQPAFTGMGFGGFTQQPQQPQQQQQPSSFQPGSLASIPQNSMASFQPQSTLAPQQLSMPTGQQTTNPFRQSMLMSNPTGMQSPTALNSNGMNSNNNTNNNGFASPANPLVPQRTSTNPFARGSPQASQPFGAPGAGQPAALVPNKTGTNPFAKDYGVQQAPRPHTAGGVSNNAPAAPSAALMPQPTGSTNPFRQSAFINQQTGMGWQHSQPTGGLLGQLETVPVFPRPAQQTPWQ